MTHTKQVSTIVKILTQNDQRYKIDHVEQEAKDYTTIYYIDEYHNEECYIIIDNNTFEQVQAVDTYNEGTSGIYNNINQFIRERL